MKMTRELAWFLFWMMASWVLVTLLFVHACGYVSGRIRESNRRIEMEKSRDEWHEYLESIGEDPDQNWREYLESIGEDPNQTWHEYFGIEPRGEEP